MEEGEQGTAGQDTGGKSFSARWGWLAAVDEVAEVTRTPWALIWEMRAFEFFTYLSYVKDKQRERQRQFDEWKRKH